MKYRYCHAKNPDRAKFHLEIGSSLIVETSPDDDYQEASMPKSAASEMQDKLGAN